MTQTVTAYEDSTGKAPVRGFLHTPESEVAHGLVLTHGAGGNSNSKLLTDISDTFAEAGFLVLRMDLPFRQAKAFGPPFSAQAAQDRLGLRRAVELLRPRVRGRIFVGGHSYGGRQATLLAADEPGLIDGLLLFSYPLHPPRKPTELRTAHFCRLGTPAMFVHGSRDPFGSLEEMNGALALLNSPYTLVAIEGAGHDLTRKKVPGAAGHGVVERFRAFFEV